MKITNFKPIMLDYADRLTSGKNPYTDVYKLQNDRIFKMLKSPSSNGSMSLLSYREFYNRFCRKLEQAKNLGNLGCLATPDEISVSDTGRVKGYLYQFNSSKTLEELEINEQDFEFITKCFLAISSEIEKLHEHNIVVPDLANFTNILYDPITGKVSFLDYDGMQVGNIPTNCISKMIQYRNNPVLKNSKYIRPNGLYTPKIDELGLIVSYLYSLSGINIASIDCFQQLYSSENDLEQFLFKRRSANEKLESLGIDDEEIKDCLIDSFTSKECKMDAHTLVKRFSDRFKHGETKVDGTKTFVRR